MLMVLMQVCVGDFLFTNAARAAFVNKSASENHSGSVFMKEYTCSATGSVACAKNYCISPVTFSVSSEFFFQVQFKVRYFAHKTFYLLTSKYLKDLLCLLRFVSVVEIN